MASLAYLSPSGSHPPPPSSPFYLLLCLFSLSLFFWYSIATAAPFHGSLALVRRAYISFRNEKELSQEFWTPVKT